jgi:hypothetical protein
MMNPENKMEREEKMKLAMLWLVNAGLFIV